jgi:hypothetical protein
MKQVYVAKSLVDAELACSELRNAGFDAVVQGDVLALPSGPFPSVWVPDDEAAAAAEAWRQLRDGGGTDD